MTDEPGLTDYLTNMGQEGLLDSRAWFPDIHEPRTYNGAERAMLHYAIGLGGEAGEVLNLVKKWHRDTLTGGELRQALIKELPDVLIYLLDLAAILEIDLATAWEAKHAELEQRWGARSPGVDG